MKGPAPSLAYADKILEGFCNAIKERFQTETQNVLNATKILNFCGWPDPGSSDMKGFIEVAACSLLQVMLFNIGFMGIYLLKD